MHEYALMEEIINNILERLRQEEAPVAVAEVVLQIGLLDIHSEAAARQAFLVLARGTPLETARLTLHVTPARMHCASCGHSGPYLVDHIHGHEPLPAVDCPACGGLATLSGGRGVDNIDLVLA